MRAQRTAYTQRQDNEGFEVPNGEIYKLACCDCGLVHQIVIIAPGLKKGTPLGMAAKRDNRATAARRRRSLHPAGSAIRWVIVGCHGLYTGQWLTRKDAISTHCEEKGHEWARCKRHGDRAVKALVRWPNDQAVAEGRAADDRKH